MSDINTKYGVWLESASEGILIIDQDGRIDLVNQSAEQLFGYPREELYGKGIDMLLPERLRDRHARHRRDYLHDPTQRPMGIGRNLLGRRRDGSEFPIEVSLSPLQTAEGWQVMCFISDITRRKAVEEALIREKERVQRYLDIAGVIILVLDKDGSISLINKKGCEILGYSESELTGKNWFDLCLPKNIRRETSSYFQQLLAGEAGPEDYYENKILTREGEERIIAWHNTVLRNGGKEVTGTLSSGEDITERLYAQKKAKLQEQQLAQADKMATLGILVSGVAHEINNPTSFILLNGKIFSKVWKDVGSILQKHYRENGDFSLAGMPFSRAYDKIAKLISGVSEGAERIQKIVKGLKDFARQDKGDLNQEVDINSVAESAILIVHNLIKKSTDHFEVKYGQNIPPVRGNFQQLEQVIINLLTNSCQALTGPENKLSIVTAYYPKQKQVRVTVRDEGEGIPEENIKHIMDPFFTTKQSSGGTGLGLSICYNITKDHGGTLAFSSAVGRGTTAVVNLPADPRWQTAVKNDQKRIIEKSEQER